VCDCQQPGLCELAANQVAGEQVVVAGSVCQPVDVDTAAIVARERQSSPFVEEGLEAQFEAGGRMEVVCGSVHGDVSRQAGAVRKALMKQA
jgi:hypothetical protein